MSNVDCLFIIPARSGSKRIPNKNIVEIAGKPLIAYTIETCLEIVPSDRVWVSTDSQEIADISIQFGAKIPGIRPESLSNDNSPDIEWVQYALEHWISKDEFEFLGIMRPTSPLRKSRTILRALNTLKAQGEYDSIRAIRPVKEHPGKMWIKVGESIIPFMPGVNPVTRTHFHSSPLQSLPEMWIQDASLEIARMNSIIKNGTISGNHVLGFEMPDKEGFDLNYLEEIPQLEKILIENELNRF